MTEKVLLDIDHTWLSSDLHLGDLWTSKMRFRQPTSDVQDRVIRDDWDSKVFDEDSVVLLGDIQRGLGDEELFEWIRERPGKKMLVSGNWDSSHKENGSSRSGWDEAFEYIFDELIIHFGEPGQMSVIPFLASHYPYGTKYPNPVDAGEMLLHGHTHKKQKTSFSEVGTLQMHVGWDAWRGLVSARDVISLARNTHQEN